MVCLRAQDQLKQIRSVTDPSGPITSLWLTSMAKKPITAGRKGMKVMTMMSTICAKYEAERL